MAKPPAPEFDVIVVGARVAGAITAALLGAGGARVLLVERVRFPRSTISTHFFRGAGLIAVLERLGVLDEVLALGSPPLRREYNVGFAGEAELTEGPAQQPGEAGFCLSVRRAPLDALLLERARREPTVTIAQPAAATALLRDGRRVVGVRLREGATEREVRARLVVGADGRHSLVAREVDAPVERHEPPRRTLYYRYVSGWTAPDGGPADAAEFSLRGDELAYVFPSDAGLTCLAVTASAAAFPAFRADPEGELARRLRAHTALAERVERSEPAGRVEGGGPDVSWIRRPTGPGWALVGDAGVHLDPWTGMGMDLAGTHAALLADAVGGWLAGDRAEAEALSDYRARRDEHARAPFDETMALARDLSVLADA